MKSVEYLAGAAGTSLGIIGTATQTNEVLQTISLIITILGALVSFVIVPLLNWYLKAKKDGKITSEEAQEAVKIIDEGSKKIEEIKKGKEEDG